LRNVGVFIRENNNPTFLKPSHSSYLSAYEDGTGCFETSAYKISTPGNYPKESIQDFYLHSWVGTPTEIVEREIYRRER
jgi:hypothetical protein